MPGSGEVRSTTGIRPSLPTAGYGRHVATAMLVSRPGAMAVHLPRRCGRATTLGVYRTGRADPTTRLTGDDCAGSFWRATLTPHGPGTLCVWWRGDDAYDAQAWGPGADWLLEQVPALIGDLDEPAVIEPAHPAVARAQHDHPGLRLGASGTLYHELLPVIIAQRITAGEAVAQWHRL